MAEFEELEALREQLDDIRAALRAHRDSPEDAASWETVADVISSAVAGLKFAGDAIEALERRISELERG